MWRIKEEDNPTETVFYIMNGDSVFGTITGQNHIKGDVESARNTAEKLVKEKRKEKIIEILKESYELISTLAGANPWCDEVEDKVNDVSNRIIEEIRVLESEEV